MTLPTMIAKARENLRIERNADCVVNFTLPNGMATAAAAKIRDNNDALLCTGVITSEVTGTDRDYAIVFPRSETNAIGAGVTSGYWDCKVTLPGGEQPVIIFGTITVEKLAT